MASRGPIFWFRRAVRLGMTLATIQPLAVALLANFARFLVDIRRLLGGIDVELEEKQVGQDAKSNTTFADVVGVDEAKKELEDIVAYLKDPSKFTRLGGKMPKGVLLWGPPGTGKTLLARAVAGEAGVPFKYASGSEFEEVYVGVGARRVRDLFQSAKKQLPCIVFIDEIDAIGSTRSMTDQQSLRQTLNQVLTELDGFSSTEGLIVVGATNFPEVLDKALLRPGRFDRHIEVPNPDVKGREDILTLHTKNVTLGPDIDLKILARQTPGMSGAELASLVNKAACFASKTEKKHVQMSDMEYAKDLVLMGAERSSNFMNEDNRRLTAYHEGGHALVASLTDGALPVHKATIVPRGGALGMVMQLPEEDMTSWSRRQMMAEMDVCMAGRAAEEIIFGPQNITSGASSDLERATSIAKNMVEKFGMSNRIGLVAHSQKSRGVPGMSEETMALVDAEVRKLAEESYKRATNLLVKHKVGLHSIAQALLEHETLDGDEVRDLLAESRVKGTGLLSWIWRPFPSTRKPVQTSAEKLKLKSLEDRMGSLENQVTALGKAANKIQDIAEVLVQQQGGGGAAASAA
mmetsp:Transcript_26414/g.41288  ORF Transcript_26414/g.41288 Transcript_26414/m.41288 type:complete len:577 (+) Transcript_26414:501-2231(+)